MKKIAIVSPYNEYNYGTVLQAYALQKKIFEFGANSEYLQYSNYVPAPFWKKILNILFSCFIPKKKPSVAIGLDDYSFFTSPEFSAFANGFDNFINSRINYSSVKYNPLSLPNCKDYDAYMVGSDQTWGEARTRVNSIYFLDRINERYPKLSYAPSIGTTHITSNYLVILKQKLALFKTLSCREKTNCELLSREMGREVSFVLDPTMLLDRDEWNRIAQVSFSSKLIPGKYILCYILGEKQSISDYAEKLGKEKGLPVYYIVTRPLYLHKENHIFATPETFLGLIRDANTVVTDSFHGSIFCINYGTQFYSFTKREDDEAVDNDRILEILNTFHLANRFKDGNCDFDDDIDFSVIAPILNQYRENSLSYLKMTINNI